MSELTNNQITKKLRCIFSKLAKLEQGTSFEQVNADWNATTGPAQILNKPVIPASSGIREWIGLIFNPGTATAPTINTVRKNTLSGITVNGTLTREALGVYSLRLPGYDSQGSIHVQAIQDEFSFTNRKILIAKGGDGMGGTQITITVTNNAGTPIELDDTFDLRIYQF